MFVICSVDDYSYHNNLLMNLDGRFHHFCHDYFVAFGGQLQVQDMSVTISPLQFSRQTPTTWEVFYCIEVRPF